MGFEMDFFRIIRLISINNFRVYWRLSTRADGAEGMCGYLINFIGGFVYEYVGLYWDIGLPIVERWIIFKIIWFIDSTVWSENKFRLSISTKIILLDEKFFLEAYFDIHKNVRIQKKNREYIFVSRL